MKFKVTWLEEKSTTIDAADMKRADAWAKAYTGRLGDAPPATLKSVEVVPAEPSLLSFGRPPRTA